MSRLAKLALHTYPPSFRARYGDELAALVDDLPESPRTTVNLFAGSLRAWLRPTFNGPDGTRLRLQATISTTWIAWCAGFLVVPALNKALLDPPGIDAVAAVNVLMHVATALLLVGWAIALVGLGIIVAHGLIPALRVHGKKLVGPLVPGVVLAVVVVIGFVALVLTRPEVGHPPAGLIWASAGWLIALVAFLACLGIGPTVSLRRLNSGLPMLRAPMFLGSGLALVLAAMSVCSVIAALLGRDATLLSSVLPVILVLLIAIIASVVAVVSSARGINVTRQK